MGAGEGGERGREAWGTLLLHLKVKRGEEGGGRGRFGSLMSQKYEYVSVGSEESMCGASLLLSQVSNSASLLQEGPPCRSIASCSAARQPPSPSLPSPPLLKDSSPAFKTLYGSEDPPFLCRAPALT